MWTRIWIGGLDSRSVPLSPIWNEQRLLWDDRTGLNGQTDITNCAKFGEWQHIAIQKSSGSDVHRVYLDGALVITQSVPNTAAVLDQIYFYGGNSPIVREFVVRGVDPYPTVVYTPGATQNITSSIGDSQRRWNSFML